MLLYIEYPSWIRPEVFSFLPIRWYAVMYLVAFGIAYLIFSYLVKHQTRLKLTDDEWQSVFLSGIIGLLIGARLFSVFFYSDGWYYFTHPWIFFWPFQNGQFVGLPGMSYHGGVVGAMVGGGLYMWRKKIPFLYVTDMIVTGIPLGYTFGRIGNFINGELYGRVTTKPWGMVFPSATPFSTTSEWVRDICEKVGISYAEGGFVNLPRHPSQLYEAFFEGIVLFLLLWYVVRPLMKKYALKDGTMLSAYLFGYGFFRFIIEYCRQPDSDIGYVIALGSEHDNIALFQSFLNISKGQVFCLLMMVSAIILYVVVNFRRKEINDKQPSKRSKR